MRKIVLGMVIMATGLALAGCGKSAEERAEEARLAKMSPQERKVQEILDNRCVKCHTPPDAKKNLDLTDADNLIPLINSDFLFDDIKVYHMLMGPDTIAEHKKPQFQLKQNEIDLIRQWVLADHPEIMKKHKGAPSDSSAVKTPTAAG